MGAYLYILRCADGSYYVGTTIQCLERRVAEHQSGACGGYTADRRPVALVFHQHFDRLEDAAAAERQVKGWRREKKEAFAAILRRCRFWLAAVQRQFVLRDAALGAAPQDDDGVTRFDRLGGLADVVGEAARSS
jgi:putative endonuclease